MFDCRFVLYLITDLFCIWL